MYRNNAFVPQDPRPKHPSIFLGVTAVVVTGLVSIGSLVFVSYRMGTRQAVVAETKVPPSPITSSSPEAPLPASPESPIEEDDSVPPPTSYGASLKARPAWSLEPSFAPQPVKPLEVFVHEPIWPRGTDWSEAVRLRNAARAVILEHCGEPDAAAAGA